LEIPHDPLHAPHHSPAADARGFANLAFPVLLAVASTALLAAVAGLFGWYPAQMYAISSVAGLAVVVAASATAWLRFSVRREVAHALQATGERLGSIIDTAMDAIITMDEAHNIVLFNGAAERVFGRTRQSVIGEKLEILLPQRHHAAHQGHVRHFGTTGVSNRRMGDQTVLLGIRANGEEFPIDASISQHGEPGHKLFTVILRDISLRLQNEHDLRQSREEIRELASASQTAREQERSRVARELHDEIGGALTALKMDTAWISERLPQGESVLAEKLSNMRTMLDNTVAATRRIASDLRPMMLDDLGLAPATEWLVHDFERRTGIVCELAIALPEIDIPGDLATAVFRILQESLTNVTKHARATHAEITLDTEEGMLVLTINDNGRGFDTTGPRAPQSYGLIGMRERVTLLGGRIRVESVPGDGTIVEARIPLAQPETKA
jgi:PAS domain S-box-containing protein